MFNGWILNQIVHFRSPIINAMFQHPVLASAASGTPTQEEDLPMVIKRISPMSCAKVTGLLYALIGFLLGACFSLIMLAVGSAFTHDPELSNAVGARMFGAFFGAGAIIILPIFYGVLGFVGGAIVALIYNVIAGMIGGLEIDVE
jgi:hypothetical protein